MDKIPFCFPVFYLGLIEGRARVLNQKEAMNILFNGSREVDTSWEIQKEAANKYINGGEGIPKHRIKSVFELSEAELAERIGLLEIWEPEICVFTFHEFLCERVEISEETSRRLETILQQGIKSASKLYIATAFRESLKFNGPTKEYLSEELKKELRALHQAPDALLRVNKLKIKLQDRTWGDNSIDKHGYSKRRTYTTAEIASGILGDRTAVFNSIFDKTVDERKFVSACEASALGSGQQVSWQNGSIEVQDGETYTIRIYVHNDNLNGYRSVAEKTRVKYVIPTEISNEQEIRGYIASSNALPSEYWSSIILKSDTNVFSLHYVAGSFMLHNAATGSRGCHFKDFRNDSYAMIGYKYLDGEYPGGNQYASYISVQVRVVFEAQCRIKTTQRIIGSPDGWWYRTTEAEIGDLVECQFYYLNTSDALQENLMVRYVLPDNMEYIPGSTVLYNSNFQKGVGLKDDTITTSGINIGHYKPQGNAYVRFTARVIDKSLSSGLNCLINWGAATVEGKVAKDNAQLYVTKE